VQRRTGMIECHPSSVKQEDSRRRR